jgi:hypothetical protein
MYIKRSYCQIDSTHFMAANKCAKIVKSITKLINVCSKISRRKIQNMNVKRYV